MPTEQLLEGMLVAISKRELADFIEQEFGLADLEDDTPLFSSGLLDSTCMIMLVTYIEEQTDLMLQADDLTLDNFDSISAMSAFLAARTA